MLADSNRLSEDLMAEIHASFTDPRVRRATFVIGYITMLNLFNNSLNVRSFGGYRALLDGEADGLRGEPGARTITD